MLTVVDLEAASTGKVNDENVSAATKEELRVSKLKFESHGDDYLRFTVSFQFYV